MIAAAVLGLLIYLYGADTCVVWIERHAALSPRWSQTPRLLRVILALVWPLSVLIAALLLSHGGHHGR